MHGIAKEFSVNKCLHVVEKENFLPVQGQEDGNPWGTS